MPRCSSQNTPPRMLPSCSSLGPGAAFFPKKLSTAPSTWRGGCLCASLPRQATWSYTKGNNSLLVLYLKSNWITYGAARSFPPLTTRACFLGGFSANINHSPGLQSFQGSWTKFEMNLKLFSFFSFLIWKNSVDCRCCMFPICVWYLLWIFGSAGIRSQEGSCKTLWPKTV